MGSPLKHIEFTKMHGAGNDYIYVDALRNPDSPLTDLPTLARLISDRHFGVGADGLVLILPSETADFRMRMFNADGSEAQMCGNASRCIGKYLYEMRLTRKHSVSLETRAGIKTLHLSVDDTNGKVTSVTVDMGEPEFDVTKIPVASPGHLDVEIPVGSSVFHAVAVSMGNPHGVIFTDEISDDLVLNTGAGLSIHEVWPEDANIEFVKVDSPDEITMRVYERGSGETLACGTGACASVVACVLKGLTSRRVRVKLPGGSLFIEWREADNHVFLTGGAEFVAEGRFFLPSANVASRDMHSPPRK